MGTQNFYITMLRHVLSISTCTPSQQLMPLTDPIRTDKTPALKSAQAIIILSRSWQDGFMPEMTATLPCRQRQRLLGCWYFSGASHLSYKGQIRPKDITDRGKKHTLYKEHPLLEGKCSPQEKSWDKALCIQREGLRNGFGLWCECWCSACIMQVLNIQISSAVEGSSDCLLFLVLLHGCGKVFYFICNVNIILVYDTTGC